MAKLSSEEAKELEVAKAVDALSDQALDDCVAVVAQLYDDTDIKGLAKRQRRQKIAKLVRHLAKSTIAAYAGRTR